jgi:hypothetical protein
MSYSNSLPMAEVCLPLCALDPVSQAASAVTSAWVAVQNFHSFVALLDTGVFGGSATIDFKLMQATSSGGAGSKALTNPSTGVAKAITQLAAGGGNNRLAAINARASDLDQANGYGYIAMVLTVGTAASLVSAVLLGFFPRFDPASDSGANPTYNFGSASIAQIVS